MKKPTTVHELFEQNPSCWIQGHMAEDRLGIFVEFDDPSACKWCLWGAINHIYGKTIGIDIRLQLMELCHKGVVIFNDNSNCTVDDIIKLTKKAGV